MSSDAPAPRTQRHGNIFSRDAGTMLIHVQRQNGLAHRTLVLRPWQVQLLRVVASRWGIGILLLGLVSWSYFAVQAARIPFLTTRLTHLEEDAQRIDTLQRTLATLQSRYEQVQKMLSTTSPTAATKAAATATKTKAPEPAAEKRADGVGGKSGEKARTTRPDSSSAQKKTQP